MFSIKRAPMFKLFFGLHLECPSKPYMLDVSGLNKGNILVFGSNPWLKNKMLVKPM
jgi:hypothetical protein